MRVASLYRWRSTSIIHVSCIYQIKKRNPLTQATRYRRSTRNDSFSTWLKLIWFSIIHRTRRSRKRSVLNVTCGQVFPNAVSINTCPCSSGIEPSFPILCTSCRCSIIFFVDESVKVTLNPFVGPTLTVRVAETQLWRSSARDQIE